MISSLLRLVFIAFCFEMLRKLDLYYSIFAERSENSFETPFLIINSPFSCLQSKSSTFRIIFWKLLESLSVTNESCVIEGLDSNQVEPCCWMTYTSHRNTQEVLSILDTLDLDTDKTTEEELVKKFGLEEQFARKKMSRWQKNKPRLWQIFEEPYSSTSAKVSVSFS